MHYPVIPKLKKVLNVVVTITVDDYTNALLLAETIRAVAQVSALETDVTLSDGLEIDDA